MQYFKTTSEAKVRPTYPLKKHWFLQLSIWATEPWYMQWRKYGNRDYKLQNKKKGSFRTISHFISSGTTTKTSLFGQLRNFLQNIQSFLVSMFGTLFTALLLLFSRKLVSSEENQSITGVCNWSYFSIIVNLC